MNTLYSLVLVYVWAATPTSPEITVQRDTAADWGWSQWDADTCRDISATIGKRWSTDFGEGRLDVTWVCLPVPEPPAP